MTPDEALPTAQQLSATGVPWFKVGLELYIKGGGTLVRKVKDTGAKVFLDLKLHDIPNTVQQATAAAAATGADLLTVHALGGPQMLKAARAGAGSSTLKVVAVTLLTSHSDDELAAFAPPGTAMGAVARRAWIHGLAACAAQGGVHGIVCSALDLADDGAAIRALPWASAPFIVTPGIREPGTASNDQSRVATPELASRSGSSLVVVGRPILQPADGDQIAAAKRFLLALGERNV